MNGFGERIDRLLDRLLSDEPVQVVVLGGPSVTDWWMVWLTGVLGFATLGVAIATYFASRRASEAQLKAERAQEIAAREQSIRQDLQLARLLRATQDSSTQTADQRRRGVRWDIVRVEPKQYELKNVGDETALHVELDEIVDDFGMPEDLYVDRDDVPLAPGASLPFTIERSIASPAVTVALITWVDQEGVRQHEQRLIR